MLRMEVFQNSGKENDETCTIPLALRRKNDLRESTPMLECRKSCTQRANKGNKCLRIRKVNVQTKGFSEIPGF